MGYTSSLDNELKKKAAPKQKPYLHCAKHFDGDAAFEARVERAIQESCLYFFRAQKQEVYRWEELESNTTITSEYIMMLYLLEILDPGRKKSMAKYLLSSQLPNGAWPLYHGDEGNLSISIEAYFALKLAGESPESEPLKKAREFILDNGGIEAARIFTKIWLALFSQYDWDKVPSMPVELVLLPSNLYFSIYEFSMWARSTVVLLSVVMAIRPKYRLPETLSITELHAPSGSAGSTSSCTYKLFYLIDRFVKMMERRPSATLRKLAIQEAKRWILDHQEESGDWGGIQPAMVYSLLALHYLGYPLDHEIMTRGLKAFEAFCIEDDQGLRLQSGIQLLRPWRSWRRVWRQITLRLIKLHPGLLKSRCVPEATGR